MPLRKLLFMSCSSSPRAQALFTVREVEMRLKKMSIELYASFMTWICAFSCVFVGLTRPLAEVTTWKYVSTVIDSFRAAFLFTELEVNDRISSRRDSGGSVEPQTNG